MLRRSLVLFTVAAFLAPIILFAQATPAKQSVKLAAKNAWTTPRTRDGHPDLEGIWTNATVTRMERLP